MKALKEQEAVPSDGTSDGTSEGGGDDDDADDINIGPNSHISLLDQHSELKRKAEGGFIYEK